MIKMGLLARNLFCGASCIYVFSLTETMRARNYSIIKYDVLAFDSAIVREISTIVRARTVSEERGRIWNHRGRFWTIADAVAEMSGRSRKMGHR